MAQVYARANKAAAYHVDTRRRVRQENRRLYDRARRNLNQANSTHRITLDGYFPAYIETAEHGPDCFTILNAPNAMALEFGHAPSGFFAPERFGKETKAPFPTFILTQAAYGGHTM